MIRKINVVFVLLLLAVIGASSSAFADSYTWGYQNSNMGGYGVNAAVTVTTTLNGFDVSVVNLLAGVTHATQLVGGIELKYNSGLSSAMKSNLNNSLLQSSSGLQRNINSGGSFSNQGMVETNWDLSSSYFSGGLALCASSCGDFDRQGIVGAPKTSTGQYTGVDSSVYGSANRPELAGTMDQPVTFHVYAAGVTSSTSVSSLVSGANFIFGDGNAGTYVKSGTQYTFTGSGNTPEPASIFLIGSGLLAVGRKLRTKK